MTILPIFRNLNLNISKYLKISKFSSKSTKKPEISGAKVINSHVKVSKEEAKVLNELRGQEIFAYQKELEGIQKSHAQFAQSFPTREEREKKEKKVKYEKRQGSWESYVEGMKRCLNPPVEELQAAGKIPRVDPERRKNKLIRGRDNLLKALKPVVLMRRKYLNYLSTEIIPTLITPTNLEAKIGEAVDGRGAAATTEVSYNLNAEGVVEVEKEVKRKLKQIRVGMDEFEEKRMSV